jgi:FKBP-type peptidyl-prolyl cis-trans isomerase FkpA
MQSLKKVFGFLAAAVLLTACNNVDFKKTKAGVPYKLFSKGSGDSIRTSNVVKFDVVYKTKDTVLFDSYKQGTPQYLPLQPLPPTFTYNDIGTNLTEIFLKAKKGDSIYITQSTDSLLKDPQMANAPFKKGDQIITTIRIVEVYKTNEEAQAAANKDRFSNYGKTQAENLKRFQGDTSLQHQVGRDSKVIEEYLAKNNIQTTKTNWGLYVQVLNPGQGPKPAPGQYVSVKYKGTTLEGQLFDSGVYPMQVGVGGSIPGFEMGVMELSKGGKANIYIPSTLAYGPRGSGPKIGPNENLIFEIELLDISDKPLQPPPAALDTTGARR